MVCKHCGKPVSATDTYCPHCKEDLLGNTVQRPKEGTSVFTKIVIGFAILIGGVFMLGIVAAIAIPKFANTKQKAYVSMMRHTDLPNLAAAEEKYFASHNTYTASLAELNFRASPAVEVTVTAAGPAGWAAKATHPGTEIVCQVAFGADSIRGVGDGIYRCR
jgi:Tfp pilus assembly protein PilE